MTEEQGVEPIAIIGLAVRAPGAADAEQFWRNLVDGTESIQWFSPEQEQARGANRQDLDNPGWVSAAPVLDDLEMFDAGLFDMSPREARLADPQHRIFLECAHTALEDAGYDPRQTPGSVGVYAGSGQARYEWLNLRTNRQLWAGDAGQLSVTSFNSPDHVATQVSYRLNLRGPSMTVQTACSTSLVAVHLACEAVRNGECDMALAGGVSVELPHGVGYLSMEGFLAPDARCRPFDAQAAGTLWGSGAGVVLVKRLSDALADGDHIRAVIRGNAVNNDGSGKVGYSAPSVEGQSAVIAQAVEVAGVDPRTISYVEAHGTGTALGDPIEVAALSAVYTPAGGQDRQWCAIGSVKSNIGHLSHAAGVVGLAKAVLALQHGVVPPSLHYEQPNPQIDFAQSPFYVAATLAKFDPVEQMRRAAVSSFGVGGTNAHLVLEQAPARTSAGLPPRPAELLQISGRSKQALSTAAQQLADRLAQAPELSLAEVGHTLRTGRTGHPYRAAVVATDIADAAVALRDTARWRTGRATDDPPAVAFLFSGQGSQYAGMGRKLAEAEPVFAEALTECLSLLPPQVRQALSDPTDEAIDQTWVTQPALFALEFALARLWRSWGVEPAAMVGHSIGEYVAAVLAGVFTLSDALALVTTRGQLMQSMPVGAMAAVTCSEAELRAQLPESLVIASVNGPGSCVVAGASEDVARFSSQLLAAGVGVRELRTSHAFHSPMMDPIVAGFEQAVAGVTRREPQLPFWSNVTGARITAEQATDPAYWAQQLRQPVRFGDCVAAVLAQPGQWRLLECGPGRQLAGLARRQLPAGAPEPLTSLPNKPADDELSTLYGAAGKLWTEGVPVRPTSGTARRVPLPTYPFQRERHWSDPDPVPASAEAPASPAPAASVTPTGGLENGAVPVQATTEVGQEQGQDTGRATEYVAPRTQLESQLVDLWGSVLGVDQVGVTDDFFALGGDSLVAVQLVAQARSATRVKLPMRILFEYPTVAGMAEQVIELRAGATEAAIPKLRRGDAPAATEANNG